MQRLGVASVFVLGLLVGASAFMIQSYVDGQSQPQVNSPPQTSQVASSTTTSNTNSTSTSTNSSSGLLTTTTLATYDGD